jgi:hypothetical protein
VLEKWPVFIVAAMFIKLIASDHQEFVEGGILIIAVVSNVQWSHDNVVPNVRQIIRSALLGIFAQYYLSSAR